MCDRPSYWLKAVIRDGSRPLERRARSKRDYGREACQSQELELDLPRICGERFQVYAACLSN